MEVPASRDFHLTGDPPESTPIALVGARRKGLGSTQLRRELGGEQDLVSIPRGELIDEVATAIARSRTRRDRAFVERALEEAIGGSRVQETLAALQEQRVEHLALAPTIGDPAEALVRGALAGDPEITIARDGSPSCWRRPKAGLRSSATDLRSAVG